MGLGIFIAQSLLERTGARLAFVDGALRTGDIGYVDEAGWYYIVDRLFGAAELRLGVGERREGEVELGREGGGKAGRPLRPSAPDDERRMRLLHGLGQTRAVL